MNNILQYIILAALVPSSLPVADDIYQQVDEQGVKLGAYYGCYTDDSGELVCILLDEAPATSGDNASSAGLEMNKV